MELVFANFFYIIVTLLTTHQSLSHLITKFRKNHAWLVSLLLIVLAMPICFVLIDSPSRLVYFLLVIIIGSALNPINQHYRPNTLKNSIVFLLFCMPLWPLLKELAGFPNRVFALETAFIFYSAAHISLFFSYSRSISNTSSTTKEAKPNFKLILAVFISGLSLCFLAAEFLGFFKDIVFFKLDEQKINLTYSILWVGAMTLGVEVITKIGLYKTVFKFWHADNPILKILITSGFTAILHYWISASEGYLVLGILIGFLTASLYHLGGLWLSILFRVCLISMSFAIFGVLI